MRKVVGAFFQSLDGVVQAPGAPTEDPTGDFPYGGWLGPLWNDAADAAIGALFTPPYALLLGRRTYDIFAAYWPFVEGEERAMGAAFTAAEKFVFTRDDAPLDWANSHRLRSMEDLAAVKRGDGPDLIIQGSSTLYPELLRHGLLDRLIVMTFPIVLGTGKRAFADGPVGITLKQVDHRPDPKGGFVTTYEPGAPAELHAIGPSVDSAAERERQRRMTQGSW